MNRKIPVDGGGGGAQTWDPRPGGAFLAAGERTHIGSEGCDARGATRMASMIQVEAARIPDRDKLLELLREHGLDAKPENEVAIVVPCEDGGNELVSYIEGVIMQIGAP